MEEHLRQEEAEMFHPEILPLSRQMANTQTQERDFALRNAILRQKKDNNSLFEGLDDL